MTAPISSRTTIPPTMNLARFNTADESISDMSRIPFGDRRHPGQTSMSALFETSMGAGKYHRHEEQCGDRGKQQSADDGAAQGGILFGPLAQAERHGNHTDDHRHGGHQYRGYAGAS